VGAMAVIWRNLLGDLHFWRGQMLAVG
jgi:hypothetical protein